MRPEDIFTASELEAARSALAAHRPSGAYEPGKWMVHPLNRSIGKAQGRFPAQVVLRDITLRTIEQMPGIANTEDERLAFLSALAEAGVREFVVTMFRRGHGVEEMRRQVAAVTAVSADSKVIYNNAVNEAELELAAAAGISGVDILSMVYLGKAMPVSAGAVYHRVWQGREWRSLRFPSTVDDHLDRSRRLITAGAALGLRMTSVIALLQYASEEYVARHCKAVAGAGAFEVVLACSSGGTGPEAMTRLVEVAKEAAPGLRVGVHCHNIYGLAVATSIAAARAGAEAIEVSVNGYDVGPAGAQASLAGTAAALEALYGVNTGIDLSHMFALSQHAAALTGWDVPWNEPVLGSGCIERSHTDLVEQEEKFDRLIHSSLMVENLGAPRRRRIGISSGPLNMWDKLDDLGIRVSKDQVEPILRACWMEIRNQKRALTDDEIRVVALRTLEAARSAGSL